MVDKVSYIIGFRESNAERLQALQFVLRRIRRDFPEMEVLVIEQDKNSKISFDPILKINHVFIFNEGLYNRSWAFNCAVKNTKKEFFCFADADIILEKEGFLKCVNALDSFDACTPNKETITNVAIDEDAPNQLRILNQRKLYSFAGGMLFITKLAFDKIGGWDERFEGWGGEDNAMSHLIYNRLKSKTFGLTSYHIDHPHEYVTGQNQPQYQANKTLAQEIITRNGPALYQYTEQLKALNLGNTEKYSVIENTTEPLKFVLAVTTFNRLSLLKNCIETFLKTKSDSISWQIIIADDNSTDGTKEYLKSLEEHYDAIIIRNDRTHIHHQVNTILQRLSDMSFDLCFKCDDDVQFIKEGWDLLYWKVIQRTGYDHLVFYDKNWQPHVNLARPIRFGELMANCEADKIQGAMYTLTERVIDKVGYFDEQQFGASGLGHVDYSFRCCRAGFNVLTHPFDVENSNNYVSLQTTNSFSSATSLKNKSISNSKEILAQKQALLKMSRVFVDYNENFQKIKTGDRQPEEITKASKKGASRKFKKTDATFYPDRGISGFFGFLLKRIYNLSIDLNLNFIPMGIHKLGKSLNKISIDILNIEQ